jgi:hypothetical protein
MLVCIKDIYEDLVDFENHHHKDSKLSKINDSERFITIIFFNMKAHYNRKISLVSNSQNLIILT